MRKTLGILLTAALIVPGPASAELFNNLKISGRLDVQSTSARNALDFATGPNTSGSDTTAAPLTVTAANNDRIGATLTRTMVKAEWDLLDDVHATVGFVKNDRAWATTAVGDDQVTGAASGNQTVGATGGTDVLGNIMVNLANVKIDKMMGHFDMTFGRQYYGEPGDLVYYVGPRDTLGLFVQSIDAVRMDASNDWMNVTGLYATTGHTGGIGTANNGIYVRGLDMGWKNLPMKANTFIWNRVIQGGAGALALGTPPTSAGGLSAKNDNLWVYGVKLRGEAAGGWLSLDLAGNLGENRAAQTAVTACTSKGCNSPASRYRGWGFLADAGYNAEVANVGGFTPWGTFGFGTGRSSNMEAVNEGFTTMSSDFRPGVINRRFAGTNAAAALGSGYLNSTVGATGIPTNNLNNRVVWGLGLNYTPAMEDRLTVGASLWDFRLQRVTDTTTVGAPAHAGNKHLGSEFGLTGEWRHSENVTLGFGWANFHPGGFVKESISSTATTAGAPTSPVEMWFADLSVKF